MVRIFCLLASVFCGHVLAQNLHEVGRLVSQVIAVADVEAAKAQVRETLVRYGGYVQEMRDEDETTVMNLRVAIEAVDRFLTFLRGLGQIVEESEQVHDPTPMFATLNSKISALEFTEIDLREQLSFLSPDDALALDIQRELERVRTQRLSLLSERTLLEEQSRYAFVQLSLKKKQDSKSFWEEVKSALHLALFDPGKALRTALVTTIGILLPYAVLVLLLFTLAKLGRRVLTRFPKS